MPTQVTPPPSSQRLLPVLSAQAMRTADRLTIETFGLPTALLMETAGRETVHAMEKRFGPLRNRRVVCLCGKGNNGGDGLVIARGLLARGAHVQVVTLAPASEMTSETARNFKRLETLSAHDDCLSLYTLDAQDPLNALSGAHVYVDALLGAGLTSPPRPPIDRLVAWLNDQDRPVVAVDVPTGLHSDTGTILEEAVQADLTVTMAALKAGLVVGTGPQTAGAVEVVEIGIPTQCIEQATTDHPEGTAWYPTDAAIRTMLPHRPPDAHKYTAGLALVIAGAPGMTGAPVLATRAAARIGAGFVTCATHEAVQQTISHHLVEATTLGLPVSEDNGIDPSSALDVLEARLQKARSLLIGPGLGSGDGTAAFVRSLLSQVDIPAVIDADGLNALAADPGFLEEHGSERWILTPHMGEFKRLAGEEVDVSNPIQVARRYAHIWNCVLILKGQPSLVATPQGTVYVNSTGNAALATAGTGDVLAGMSAGLLAQGASPEHAAISALHLGGACVERYTSEYGRTSMVASDILLELPRVLRERYHR